MIRQILILFSFTLSTSIYGQSLLDKVFLSLPYERYVDLTKDQRMQLLNTANTDNRLYINNTNDYQWVGKIDCSITDCDTIKSDTRVIDIRDYSPSSGYMHWYEAMFHQDYCTFNTMCYWNKTDRSKLIGYTYHSPYSGGPTEQKIRFYERRNEVQSEVDSEKILPTLTIEHLLTARAIPENSETRQRLEKVLLRVIDIEYKLPKVGKNIECVINPFEDYVSGSDLKLFEIYQSQLIRKITLIWNEGTFVIQK